MRALPTLDSSDCEHFTRSHPRSTFTCRSWAYKECCSARRAHIRDSPIPAVCIGFLQASPSDPVGTSTRRTTARAYRGVSAHHGISDDWPARTCSSVAMLCRAAPEKNRLIEKKMSVSARSRQTHGKIERPVETRKPRPRHWVDFAREGGRRRITGRRCAASVPA